MLPISTLIALLSTSAGASWTEAVEAPAPALEASRICEISFGSNKSLTIVAGPLDDISGNTDRAGIFPETVDCSIETENGAETEKRTCSKWNYKFISDFNNLSHVYIGMSSDLDLVQLIPSNGTIINYSSQGPNLDKRLIMWDSAASTQNVSFITSLAEPRIATAGGKKGYEKFCLIQGAGVPLENNGYAQETLTSRKIIESSDGQSQLCTKVNPTNQCEIAVDCVTGEPLPEEEAIDLTELVGVAGVNGVDPVANFSVPGQACPTAVFDNGLPNTRYYCSGGRCWAF